MPAPSRHFACCPWLRLPAALYGLAVRVRNQAFDRGWLPQEQFRTPVISVGNLAVGGTGKTPHTELLIRLLQPHARVAVLSRGYRSRDRSLWSKLRKKFSSKKMEVPPRVVSDGKDLLLDSMTAGDEPFMLASNLKNVVVLVDKDRVKSGLYAIDEFGTDTLILDDGFQYLRLKAHINILLVDSTAPFDNHHVLPRGLLREPIKNIKRADYIFLTKSDGSPKLRHLKIWKMCSTAGGGCRFRNSGEGKSPRSRRSRILRASTRFSANSAERLFWRNILPTITATASRR